MKALYSTFALVLMLAMPGCGYVKKMRHHDEKVSSDRENNIDEVTAKDISLLPKARFAFSFSFEKCSYLGNFMESYQRRYLPDHHVVFNGDCSRLPDATGIVRSVDIVKGADVVASIYLTVTYGAELDLDTKPHGDVFVKWDAGKEEAIVPNIAATFTKWVDENSSTPREACEELELNAEDCTTMAKEFAKVVDAQIAP